MQSYAVIESGGKQYLVRSGDQLAVDRLAIDEGKETALSDVLAVSDGKELKVGTPMVKGASVKAQVVEHTRGPKVVSFKKRRRKGSKKKIGHRQELTVLKITDIVPGK